VEKDQVASLKKVKSKRDNGRVKTCLSALKKAAQNGENHM
jgi:methylmalonyl-CoA mutase N-terminal domain/subunit